MMDLLKRKGLLLVILSIAGLLASCGEDSSELEEAAEKTLEEAAEKTLEKAAEETGFDPKKFRTIPLAEGPSDDGRNYVRCTKETEKGSRLYRVYRIDTQAKTLHDFGAPSRFDFKGECKYDKDCQYIFRPVVNCETSGNSCSFSKDKYEFSRPSGEGMYERVFYRDTGRYVERSRNQDTGKARTIGEWEGCEAIVNPQPNRF